MAKNKNKNKTAKATKATRESQGGIGDGVGTSAFTHQDDAGADIHPSDPGHHEGIFYGGRVPVKSQLEEIVVGPPAFGSPDARTLGHQMVPPGGESAASAPNISEDYAGGKAVAGYQTLKSEDSDEDTSDETEWKKSDNKPELLKVAQARGLDVTEETTKDEIVAALEKDDSESEEDTDEDEDAEDEDTEDNH